MKKLNYDAMRFLEETTVTIGHKDMWRLLKLEGSIRYKF